MLGPPPDNQIGNLLRIRELAGHLIERPEGGWTFDYLEHYAGESAMAMWINADGGLGVGSALKLKDPKAAGKAMRELMQMLSKDMAQLIRRRGHEPRTTRR